MARFNYGSTVIVLLPPGVAELAPGLSAESPVQAGPAVGDVALIATLHVSLVGAASAASLDFVAVGAAEVAMPYRCSKSSRLPRSYNGNKLAAEAAPTALLRAAFQLQLLPRPDA